MTIKTYQIFERNATGNFDILASMPDSVKEAGQQIWTAILNSYPQTDSYARYKTSKMEETCVSSMIKYGFTEARARDFVERAPAKAVSHVIGESMSWGLRYINPLTFNQARLIENMIRCPEIPQPDAKDVYLFEDAKAFIEQYKVLYNRWMKTRPSAEQIRALAAVFHEANGYPLPKEVEYEIHADEVQAWINSLNAYSELERGISGQTEYEMAVWHQEYALEISQSERVPERIYDGTNTDERYNPWDTMDPNEDPFDGFVYTDIVFRVGQFENDYPEADKYDRYLTIGDAIDQENSDEGIRQNEAYYEGIEAPWDEDEDKQHLSLPSFS